MSKVLAIAGSVLLALAIAIAAILWYVATGGKPKPVPDKVEAIGPLEIVTHTSFYRTGWNTGKLGWGRTERYSLSYRGNPITIQGRAGMSGDKEQTYSRLNSVVTFPAPEPAVVVNVGDPNNTSLFYLVRDGGGGAKVEHLGDSSGGVVSAGWLDSLPDERSETRDVAVHRMRLKGGRFLLLGEYTVLNTQTLKAYQIPRASGVSLNQFKPPIAMSPDGNSFVRFGYSMDSNNAPMLAVFDFVAGLSAAVPVDRKRARFNKWEDIDAAWLDHYFEWRGKPGEHVRLAARHNAAPLPYRGDREVDGYDPTQKSYSLTPVQREMFAQVIQFIEREYKGSRLPKRLEDHDSLMVGDQKVNVTVQEMSAKYTVSIWMDRGQDSSLVYRIGDSFDGALRTGRYDDFFLP